MDEYNFDLKTPFEEILKTQYWTASTRGIQTERYQALLTAKLAKIVESADETADRLNTRVFLLNVVVAILTAVQAWPIVASWLKK